MVKFGCPPVRSVTSSDDSNSATQSQDGPPRFAALLCPSLCFDQCHLSTFHRRSRAVLRASKDWCCYTAQQCVCRFPAQRCRCLLGWGGQRFGSNTGRCIQGEFTFDQSDAQNVFLFLFSTSSLSLLALFRTRYHRTLP
jgi:hypothetical protein